MRLSGPFFLILTPLSCGCGPHWTGWVTQSRSGGGRVGGSLGLGGLCTTTEVWYSSKRLWREQKSFSHLDSRYSQTSVSLHVPPSPFLTIFQALSLAYSLTTVHISSFCSLPGWIWTHKSLRCDTLLSSLLILCPHAVCLLWLSLWFSHLTLESQSNKRQRGKIYKTKGGGVGTKVKNGVKSKAFSCRIYTLLHVWDVDFFCRLRTLEQLLLIKMRTKRHQSFALKWWY